MVKSRALTVALGALLLASPALAAPPYGSTAQETARAWGDQYANLQAVLAKMPTVNGDGGAQVHVMNFPGTQAVTGSVTASQGGSWTVGVNNFPAIQPISAVSLPLPTGASTSAAQADQLTQETAINTVLGTAVASPATYTLAYWLKTINTTLGTPLQAGGTVSLGAGSATVGVFGIDQVTPNANGVTTLSGSVTSISNAYTPQTTGSPWSQTDGTKSPLTIGCTTISSFGSFAAATLYPVGCDQAARLYVHSLAEGLTASGASATENPLLGGGRAATTDPTAVTDGQKVAQMLTPSGKTVVAPFAPPALQATGMATSTDTNPHTILAAGAGSLKNKVVSAQCYNTSTTTVVVTFNDSASTQLIVPAGGGNSPQFPVPLSTAAATAFTFTSGSAQTTVGCAAQGFLASN